MPKLRSLRTFVLSSLTVAATLATATTAYGQSCLGLPMPGKNYLGAEQREAWTGHGRQTPVYGGRPFRFTQHHDRLISRSASRYCPAQ